MIKALNSTGGWNEESVYTEFKYTRGNTLVVEILVRVLLYGAIFLLVAGGAAGVMEQINSLSSSYPRAFACFFAPGTLFLAATLIALSYEVDTDDELTDEGERVAAKRRLVCTLTHAAVA